MLSARALDANPFGISNLTGEAKNGIPLYAFVAGGTGEV
jgi:hypothetical protein